MELARFDYTFSGGAGFRAADTEKQIKGEKKSSH